MAQKVSINSSQGVYGLFSSFDYTPWQALGEFVDNSVSSWMSDVENEWILEVDITWEPEFGSGPNAGRLTILDNALGISLKDMERAFELAIPPADKTRLNQFGVGMKVAACWFGKTWSVETSAINDPVKRTIKWNTDLIVQDDINELDIIEQYEDPDVHYTKITITDLFHAPNHAKTVKKIKTHLPKIFRKYLETDDVIIRWNNEVLGDSSPEVLVAPAWNDKTVSPDEYQWETNFSIQLNHGVELEGYACLFERFDRQHTGLNYFWRNRLIQGNTEPFHRPQSLFGATNSFRTGRLYIEVIADELEVTTDKTAINFGKSGVSEDELHDAIKEALRNAGFPVSLISQGENYRSKETPPEISDQVEKSIEFARSQAQEHGQEFLETNFGSDFYSDDSLRGSEKIREAIADRLIHHSIDGQSVKFRIACVQSGIQHPWLSIEWANGHSSEHIVLINLNHPFVLRYLNAETLNVFVGIAVSLLYGEYKSLTLLEKKEIMLTRKFADKFLRYMAQHGEDIEIDSED